MLKLEGVRLPPGGGAAELAAQAARLLRLREADLRSMKILRRSVDAREDVTVAYTLAVAVDNESAVLRRCRGRKISRLEPGPLYCPPAPAPPRKRSVRMKLHPSLSQLPFPAPVSLQAGHHCARPPSGACTA